MAANKKSAKKKSAPAKKAAKKSAAKKPAVKKAAAAKKPAMKAKKAAPATKAAVKKTAPKKAAPKKTAPVAHKSSTTAKLSAVPAAAKALKPGQAGMLPLEDRILVQPDGVSEKTAGGIIIPGSVSERPNRGRVLAKGPGKRNKKGALRPLDVAVGDSVLYPPYAGAPVELDGHELLILREEEILGITE